MEEDEGKKEATERFEQAMEHGTHVEQQRRETEEKRRSETLLKKVDREFDDEPDDSD